jgi:8-oxo-dGTP diphosphatase
MKNIVKSLPVNIIGINEEKDIDFNVKEDGKEPLENARKKAWYYYKQINKPLFSCDSGLF